MDNGRFEGLSLLPYLTPNNETFEIAKDLISAHLRSSLEKHSSYLSVGKDDTSSYFSHTLQCDLIVFVSVHPISGITPEALALYENEIRFPTGQTVVKPPRLELSGVIYSPDCGTALEWRDEPAVKVERFWYAGRAVATAGCLIAGVQIWWVLKEMAERGSPSV